MWEDGALVPVAHPDCPTAHQLLGYDGHREEVVRNTRALVEGRYVNNVLLYGESGTGKSATVKNLLTLPGMEELRIIEADKENLSGLPALIRKLEGRRQKFIVFIDDLTFDRDDFWDFLDDETGDDLEYVRFTDADGLDDWGELYSYDYDDDRTYFDESDLDDGYFYYDSKDLFYDEDFTLDDLTFVADRDADGKVVELDFTAYGEDGDKAYGTVAIAIGDVGGVTAEGGDIRYYTDYSGRVQINANDIARFFSKKYPTSTLQYVTLKDVPSTGSLYYNYYGTSQYGVSSRGGYLRRHGSLFQPVQQPVCPQRADLRAQRRQLLRPDPLHRLRQRLQVPVRHHSHQCEPLRRVGGLRRHAQGHRRHLPGLGHVHCGLQCQRPGPEQHPAAGTA